ncbi:phytanoyl-CoA dioxygenase family protein [Microseira wollei]|uniref:Phytanoyl-CoA dioxygenase n=1 Tax=Microseira wollei NIES-4236 TaxID=2530354 RepID=A0AAV3XC06_9CYAN|nr:phytanoyl-CoA dioxygenase family protein [Microseira wollei]GET38946.1 phytanoyl-CoA dioxygenase [Microseira wollei NIES-4236]
MKLTREQVEEYEVEGFLFIKELFSPDEMLLIRDQIPTVIADEAVGKVWEEDGKTLRTLYGIHFTNQIFRNLVRHPRLLQPAQQLFGKDLYVFRSKIVMKPAFTGGMWGWHQDSAFAQYYEEIPSPKGGNVILFLDDVNEFNSPVYYIPGSHKEGILEAANSSSTTNSSFTLAKETIAKFVNRGGIVAPKGAAGSVLFVHYDTLHGSVGNISPFERSNFVITYSCTEESALSHKKEKPPYLSTSDITPLLPLSENESIRLLTNK